MSCSHKVTEMANIPFIFGGSDLETSLEKIQKAIGLIRIDTGQTETTKNSTRIPHTKRENFDFAKHSKYDEVKKELCCGSRLSDCILTFSFDMTDLVS